jgi:hypothetical protein
VTIVFSDQLKDQLQQRSHAMAEEYCLYDDENPPPGFKMPDETAILEFSLDGLTGVARTEWELITGIHGRDACIAEAKKHIVTP